MANKRDDICEAALHLFVEKGIASTTTREIAASASTAEGNIYRYFRGKDHLADQIFEICAGRFHRALQEAAGLSSDPSARFSAIVSAVFEFAEAEPDSFRFVLMAHNTCELNPTVSAETALPRDVFIDVVKAGVASGQFYPLDPLLVTGWVVGMAQKAILFMSAGRIEATGAQVKADTIDGALRLVSRT